jgi:hypothetical protein
VKEAWVGRFDAHASDAGGARPPVRKGFNTEITENHGVSRRFFGIDGRAGVTRQRTGPRTWNPGAGETRCSRPKPLRCSNKSEARPVPLGKFKLSNLAAPAHKTNHPPQSRTRVSPLRETPWFSVFSVVKPLRCSNKFNTSLVPPGKTQLSNLSAPAHKKNHPPQSRTRVSPLCETPWFSVFSVLKPLRCSNKFNTSFVPPGKTQLTIPSSPEPSLHPSVKLPGSPRFPC